LYLIKEVRAKISDHFGARRLKTTAQSFRQRNSLMPQYFIHIIKLVFVPILTSRKPPQHLVYQLALYTPTYRTLIDLVEDIEEGDLSLCTFLIFIDIGHHVLYLLDGDLEITKVGAIFRRIS